MNKKTFIRIINEYKEQDRLLSIAVDFVNIDSPIITFGFDMFDTLISEAFSDEDIELIYDYLHTYDDCIHVRKGNEEKVISTPEDLWNWLTNFEPECQTCTNS